MQNVACPMTIVKNPSGTWNVAKVVESAMPVTIPGSAMARMTTNEIVSRPKNEYRATASAAKAPRTIETAVAPSAHTIEVKKACWRPVLLSASPTHFSVNPDGGQADVPL